MANVVYVHPLIDEAKARGFAPGVRWRFWNPGMDWWARPLYGPDSTYDCTASEAKYYLDLDTNELVLGGFVCCRRATTFPYWAKIWDENEQTYVHTDINYAM